MKFLHTSDWHLGRSLYGRKRYDEFAQFLDWLAATIDQKSIDALLVAGDVFDTCTPSNRAQKLYYRFLCRVAQSECRHVVITAGNHDSASFLNAPKELLRALNVHVVGSITDTVEDEVILISDLELQNADCKTDTSKSQINLQKAAIVCAVPYLRDKDIRTVEAGETIEDKNRKLVEGIKAHYAEVVRIAEQKRDEMMRQLAIEDSQSLIPIVGMGHLFTSGGKTVDGDGVRELYVGSLAHVSEDVFPEAMDYLALGHLHVPQRVGKSDRIRYSGSPIPMGFGEAGQPKSVVMIEIDNQQTDITLVPVPCFQPLERIVGSLDVILAKMAQLKNEQSRAWLEIEYTGTDEQSNLREFLDDALGDSPMEIRRIKNRKVMDRVWHRMDSEETLDELTVDEVFVRCLENADIAPENQEELITAYHEIIKTIQEEDSNAE